MNIAFGTRRAVICVAALGLAAVGPAATASAAPTIALKTRALPIPGFPGTGYILGAGAMIQVEGKFSGTEYGGSPPPVIGLKFYVPAGTKLHPQGFVTCAPGTIEKDGPAPCPKQSIAGPKGSVTGVVSFGTERVQETASVQPFFAPGGSLEFFVDGSTPVSLEILGKGQVLNASSPFGLEFFGEVPLIETVPGALDASPEEGAVTIGDAYKHGKQTISYITVPKKCPPGGFRLKLEADFFGGAVAEASSDLPCPRR